MTCRECKHYESTKLGEGVCRRMPPTPIALPGQDPMGRNVIAIQSFFPPIAGDTKRCGEFLATPKLEVLQ